MRIYSISMDANFGVKCNFPFNMYMHAYVTKNVKNANRKCH